jgi:hypothetical protein
VSTASSEHNLKEKTRVNGKKNIVSNRLPKYFLTVEIKYDLKDKEIKSF